MDNPESYDVYRYIHAKSSWMSAAESFQLAIPLSEMGAKDGNIDEYMLQGVYKEYLEQNGAPKEGESYFIASVPLVYMIANGIELALKAYRYAGHPEKAPVTIVKLPELIADFLNEFPEVTWLQDLVTRYFTDEGLPSILADFMKANDYTAAEFYNTRRFLNTTTFYKLVDRYPQAFPYKCEEAKAFYEQALIDAKDAFERTEALQADIDSDGNPGDIVKALRR